MVITMKIKNDKIFMSLSILIIASLLSFYSLNVFNEISFAVGNTNLDNTFSLDESIWVWTTTMVVSTASSDESLNPKIATDSNDNVHFVWQEQNYAGTGDDWDVFYKSWNASTSLWTTTELVSTGSTSHSYFPAIAVDTAGNVHVAWHEESDYDDSGPDKDIFYRYWNVTTSTWNTTEVITTESASTSLRPSLAVDSKSNVHIAWWDYTNYAEAGSGPPDIFYKYWNASLSIWTITEVVSVNSTFWAENPSLGVDAAGNVYIAWHDFTNIVSSGEDSDIFYNYRDISTSSWNDTELVSIGSSDGSECPSLTVDTIGNVHIVWNEHTDNLLGSGTDPDVFYRCWNASTNSWSTLDVVTTESDDLSIDPSIAVDSIGNVHVAWKQWYGIYYRFWDSYSSTWTPVELISPESNADEQDPSLAVDTTRNVHIAWSDNTDYDSSGSDHDIFYKQTTEPPIFPEIVLNLPFTHRAIYLTILVFGSFILLLIINKRNKKLKRTSSI